MSQVDYLHFFNNIIWNFMHLWVMYVFISVLYVQSFYKIFRLRLLTYKNCSSIFKKQDYAFNKFMDKCKELRTKITGNFKFYKSNKKTVV